MNIVKRLEHAAIAAFKRGDTFSDFYRDNEPAIRAAAPHDRRAFGRLYRKLMSLTISGDLAGDRAVGDPEPWATDDRLDHDQHVDDTHTQARYQGTLWLDNRPCE
jgi:hypothetical protein